MFHVPEKHRITTGFLSSQKEDGNNCAFKCAFAFVGLDSRLLVSQLNVIASDGMGWEHVSVSLPDRCPTWDEMNFAKDIFWDDDDFVIQIHPVMDDYVNNHPYCLHLWRKAGKNEFCQLPPNSMVGITDKMLGKRKELKESM